MNVLLISQCTKRAREESCRILDQFAERKGDGAWQTVITLEGLNTLRRLLRKTARRNTAVACHWLKKGGETELMWIVGNLRRFSAQGCVPTNRTARDIVRRGQEHSWHSAEAMALLAAIAGLFHDFGKANTLFQQTLSGKSSLTFQPYRHEWISVRLFQAFVGQQSDREWLAALGVLEATDETRWLERLKTDVPGDSGSPFVGLPPLAQAVAWLILSHHRLPQCFLKITGLNWKRPTAGWYDSLTPTGIRSTRSVASGPRSRLTLCGSSHTVRRCKAPSGAIKQDKSPGGRSTRHRCSGSAICISFLRCIWQGLR